MGPGIHDPQKMNYNHYGDLTFHTEPTAGGSKYFIILLLFKYVLDELTQKFGGSLVELGDPLFSQTTL